MGMGRLTLMFVIKIVVVVVVVGRICFIAILVNCYEGNQNRTSSHVGQHCTQNKSALADSHTGLTYNQT